MKQSLQIKLGQQLTMTPQLQQAIRLLQLSTLELQQEIQQVLDTNPMLEVTEDASEEADIDDAQKPAPEPVPTNGDAEPGTASIEAADQHPDELDVAEAPAEGLVENLPDELPVDSDWDEIYDGATSYSQPEANEGYEGAAAGGEGLAEYLLWQLRLTPFSETDQAIALALLDSIDDNGYLKATLEEIREGLRPDIEAELAEVEAVLHRIQGFDPPGVAARDLRECLLLQLRQLPEDRPWRSQAMRLVADFLDLLAGHDYPPLMRHLHVDREALCEIVALIQSMNPRPGGRITPSAAQYIVPDVFVRRVSGSWRVELNPDIAPRIRINSYYASLVRRADQSEQNVYLRNHLQEARWFIKSLHSRNDTLLKVAHCIVERQRGFLERGDEAMKPMVLRNIAEAVEMHESTISRVTTQKYLHTPRGIYEFKYFFSSHVSTTDGGECSATAIRAKIRLLIAKEPAGKPMSDSQIAQDLLREEGIDVARRTVAKYREAMNIPPSSERKRLA